MFLGTYTPKLDEKGRLTLPAKFRDQFAGGLVVTKGQEHCLYLWPRATFEQMTAEASRAPMTVKSVRDYARAMFAGASDESPDKQGRITVPPTLRDYAGLTRDVAVVGVLNRVEVWDAERWASYDETNEQSFAELSEEVFPGV
jgi:MraZ protein